MKQGLEAILKSEESSLECLDAALEAVGHVIAERIVDHPEVRDAIRGRVSKEGKLKCVLRDEKHPKVGVYQDYHDFEAHVHKMHAHQTMAVNRAEDEKVLRASVELPEEALIAMCLKATPCQDLPKGSQIENLVDNSLRDGWKRLLAPAVSRELRKGATDAAVLEAVATFEKNLRAVLLTPPVRGSRVMAIDPGYRSGCKLAVVDATGRPLPITTRTIYPHEPQKKYDAAKAIISKAVKQHRVDVIAVGDGTASRETESMVADLISSLPNEVKYTVVSECGASVFSVSKQGQLDLPDQVPEERSAISLGSNPTTP